MISHLWVKERQEWDKFFVVISSETTLEAMKALLMNLLTVDQSGPWKEKKKAHKCFIL